MILLQELVVQDPARVLVAAVKPRHNLAAVVQLAAELVVAVATLVVEEKLLHNLVEAVKLQPTHQLRHCMCGGLLS